MYEPEAAAAIETLLNTKSRAAIIDYINNFGDPVDWSKHTTRQILDETWRSDKEAGEEENGILASMYSEL